MNKSALLVVVLSVMLSTVTLELVQGFVAYDKVTSSSALRGNSFSTEHPMIFSPAFCNNLEVFHLYARLANLELHLFKDNSVNLTVLDFVPTIVNLA